MYIIKKLKIFFLILLKNIPLAILLVLTFFVYKLVQVNFNEITIGVIISGPIIALINLLIDFPKKNEIIKKLFGFWMISVLLITTGVISQFKAYKIRKSFVSAVIMDEINHVPAFLIEWSVRDQNNPDEYIRVFDFFTNLKQLSFAGGTSTFNNAEHEYAGELLQYKIIKDMSDLQRCDFRLTGLQEGISKFTICDPVKTTDMEKVLGSKVFEKIKSNRFATTTMQWDDRLNSYIWLPQNTDLILNNDLASKKIDILINKPNFFEATIKIEPKISHASLPPGILIPEEVKSGWNQTYYFKVTMEAEFNRWTSANPKSEAYYEWLNWLFNEIERVDRISEK